MFEWLKNLGKSNVVTLKYGALEVEIVSDLNTADAAIVAKNMMNHLLTNARKDANVLLSAKPTVDSYAGYE